ncbi:MAG: NAD(P)-dependent oxidoreductase [Candidatus Woesearchaeota archaeon]
MKIIIIGASGFLGHELLKDFSRFYDTMGTYCHHSVPQLHYLDITDSEKVISLLSSFNPDIVIYPAAQPWVDFCEQHPEESYTINVVGAFHVIDWCVQHNKKYVFVSSDYVFDGTSGPYSEEDFVHPLNVYGKHKLAVEQYIFQTQVQGLIVRTTTVYGWESAGKNFVVKFIKTLQEGKEFILPSDQYATPTYVEDLSRAIVSLVQKNVTGIYHASGPQYMSRIEFAQCIAKIFSLSPLLIKGVSTSDLKQVALRPLYAGLKTDKIQRLGISFLPPVQALTLMKIRIHNL